MPPPPLDCLGCKTPSQLQILELQYLEAILNASGGGNVGTNVNLESINAVSVSTGCGAADAGTLRVSQATDCNVQVVGNVASDAVDSGNPVKIGTIGRTTLPIAVADGDRVNTMGNKYGELTTIHAIREMRANQVTTITASTAETTIVTGVASFMLDLYGLIVTNTSPTAINVAIRDATAGTIRLNIAVPANETRGFMLPASDGIKQAAAGANWTATVSASVTSVIITALTKQTT